MEIKINDAAIVHSEDIGAQAGRVQASIAPVAGGRQQNTPVENMRMAFEQLEDLVQSMGQQTGDDITRLKTAADVMHSEDEKLSQSYAEE